MYQDMGENTKTEQMFKKQLWPKASHKPLCTRLVTCTSGGSCHSDFRLQTSPVLLLDLYLLSNQSRSKLKILPA